MFKAIDLLVESAASPVKQAWDGLIRDIQKYVEHNRVSNVSGVALARGDVVYASGQGEVTAMIADAGAPEENIAVCAMDIATGDTGIVRTAGYAYVHFENDLTLVGGTPAYVSAATAGLATDAAPALARRIGIIADASGYSNANPFALVCLGYSCAPTAVPQG